jgi:chromosomal replication initiation ATPase DnaA
LRQEKEISERLNTRIPLTELIKSVSEIAGVEPRELCERGRRRIVADARSIFCFFAVRRLGYSGEAVAKALGITRSGVCRGGSRGAELVAQNPAAWRGLEGIVN